MSDPLDQQYHVRFYGKVTGPYGHNELLEMIRRNQVTRMHELSTDGRTWNRLRSLPELLDQAASLQSAANDSKPSKPNKLGVNNQATLELQLEASQPPLEQTIDDGTAGPPPEPQWYYSLGDQQIGPLSASILRAMVNQGQLGTNTLVWRQGMSGWVSPEEAGFTQQLKSDITTLSPMVPESQSVAPGPAPVDQYDSVPWNRRANVMRVFLVVGCFFVPVVLLAPVIIVLTGDVFEKSYDAQGQLKRWGVVGKGFVLLMGLLSAMGVYLLYYFSTL